MSTINKALCTPILVASVAGLISVQAVAQNSAIQFRVVAGDRNPSSCKQWDAELSRVHTFTPAGDTATLATAGGITRNMKQTTPGVFTTTLALGGTNFNIVADTSKSPKALEVTEPRTGCRWNAVAS
jgi:hypothetical protein